jgi:ubiquinone biosynthesis protein UbiJ
LSVNTFVQDSLERVLEHAVHLARTDSPRALRLLGELRDRTLAVRVAGFGELFIECDGQTLHARAAGTADAKISGSALSLLALAGPDPQAVIARGDVQIEGDAEIAQQFRELAILMRPDLETGLSRILGRSGAHLAVRGLNAVRQWSRATAWTATENVADYLAHERGDLVSRSEAEHFLRGVDQLREQLDRVDARLQHLESRADRKAR